MTLLVALSGWDAQTWVDRFAALLPDRNVVALGEPFDRREVHYAVTWKHPPGSLAGLPQSCRDLLPRRPGVDHLMGDDRLPDVPIVRVGGSGSHRADERICL